MCGKEVCFAHSACSIQGDLAPQENLQIWPTEIKFGRDEWNNTWFDFAYYSYIQCVNIRGIGRGFPEVSGKPPCKIWTSEFATGTQHTI